MLKYIAGDFPQGTTASEMFGVLSLTLPGRSAWKPELFPLEGNVQSVSLVTEENKHKLLPKAGWGLIGLATFGPAGALAGLLLGGKKKEVCFVCHMKDGKQFMGVADAKTFQKLHTLPFRSSLTSPQEPKTTTAETPNFANNPTVGCVAAIIIFVFLIFLAGH
jgi:hypothetical protein